MEFTLAPHQSPEIALTLERDIAGWPRSLPEVARRFALTPALHVAARDASGALAGGVSLVVHRDAGEGPLAWLGGMVVRPDLQGRGLGRALMAEALAFAHEAGATVVGLDATARGRPMYERHGFRAIATTTRWRRAADAPRPTPPPCESASIYPISACEIMELHAYDATRFGAGRSAWLAEVMAAFPQRAFVAFDKQSGKIVGVAMGQEDYVGPLVADAPDIAARLLYACERAGAPPVAHLLDANDHARRVFTDAGYAPDTRADGSPATCTRMMRRVDDKGTDAAPRHPGRVDAVYAIGAWALG